MNFNKMTLKLHIEWVLNSKIQKDCKASIKNPAIDTHHIKILI